MNTMSTKNLMDGERIKIKQMMPIPRGYEVMNTIRQDDGRDEMEATADTIFPYCMALIDGGEKDDYITLYCLENGGGVEDHAESMLVPKRHCPKCGKRMLPHMHGVDESTLYYICRCGYNSETGESREVGEDREEADLA